MRIVLKISGESLKGDQNISEKALLKVLNEIKEIKKNNELIIVAGGGNFWRGRNKLDIDNSTSDYIGMLGSVMNSLALESFLNKNGISAVCNGAFDISGMVKRKTRWEIEKLLKDKVVVIGGGTGLPNFSTDMTTVNAAITYNADLILMSKNIDGIYDKDPSEKDAHKIDVISHEDLYNMSVKQGIDKLLVMDLEALSALVKHKIPLYLYNNNEIDSVLDVIKGNKGTKVITKEE